MEDMVAHIDSSLVLGKKELGVSGKRNNKESDYSEFKELKKSLNPVNHKNGLGVIICDPIGHVLASCGQPVQALHSPLFAECMIVLCGISLADSAGLVPTVLETDSEVLVRLVNSHYDGLFL
ncbi:hypothetical protein ACOSQ4_016920 [Xanthoceras sorbifolium]